MIVLASTSDELRMTSSAAINHDVHMSYTDVTGGSSIVVPGRKNQTFATAQTDVAIVQAPASGAYRTVREGYIRNRHASTSIDITIKHFDGTTAVEYLKCTVLAGESLCYNEKVGWTLRDSLGRIKVRNDNLVTSCSPSFTTVVLSADQTNNNVTANTIADVTGLSFSVTSGNTYWFRFMVMYTSAATTTGSRWAINGPASPTLLIYKSEYSLTTTSRTINEAVTAYDSPAAASASSAATGGNTAWVEGIIKPSANGTVILRFASEVSSSAIVAKAGSILHWQQVL